MPGESPGEPELSEAARLYYLAKDLDEAGDAYNAACVYLFSCMAFDPYNSHNVCIHRAAVCCIRAEAYVAAASLNAFLLKKWPDHEAGKRVALVIAGLTGARTVITGFKPEEFSRGRDRDFLLLLKSSEGKASLKLDSKAKISAWIDSLYEALQRR